MPSMSKPKSRQRVAGACANCGTKFPLSRYGRKFCSAACRFVAWRKARGIHEKACAYCGVLADTVDHVPAQSVRKMLDSVGHPYTPIEVPACHECNCALGAMGFTVSQRRHLARRAIERRYQPTLTMPHWTEEDLAEMGPGLSTDITQHQILKRWVIERLKWDR